jgi:hypothetical protein
MFVADAISRGRGRIRSGLSGGNHGIVKVVAAAPIGNEILEFSIDKSEILNV